MSTPRSFVWLFAAVLVGAACSPSAEDTATSDLSPSTPLAGVTVPDATEVPPGTESSTSTTDISTPSVAPSYLVYGWDGVTWVHDNESELLVAEPVLWAGEDGAGGIVFESVAEQPGRAWLPAGADRPHEIPNGFFFLLDGRPTAMVSRFFDDMTQCENEDYLTEELTIRDLASSEERFFMCHGLGPDSEDRITSFGGALFTMVHWWWLIGSGTTVLRFYDLDGQEVTVEHNPFAESCHPCRMHARLSPDGALLAYSIWPTAFADQPEPSDGDYSRAYREWYEQQQDIPTDVVVVDMATGIELFRTDVVADAELSGFDGRVVTVTTATGRQLFNIESGETFTAPPAMTGPAPFWTVLLASLDNTTMDYDAAQLVAGDLAAQHDVETGVLWSDGFVTLNPGYWAVLTGHFPTQREAVAYCEALSTDCHARYVATVDTDGPNYYRYGDDGLHRVANGTETQLEAQPVMWAVDDLMGGVIYRLHRQLDAEKTYWLRDDGSIDTLVYNPQFVAAIDGEPTAVTFVSAADVDRDMLLVGLRSGLESRVPNIGFNGDGWSFPRSYGEGLFVGVDGAAFGCGYSDAVISFWDGDGNRIDHPHNPVAEPCGPCELSAAVSPDGRLLAYSHRADSPSEYHGRLTCGGQDDWWNETQEILAEVVVLDLGTGDELHRVTAPARASVVDFDGRFVVVDQGDWVESKIVSVIYDTWGVREPVEVESGVALIRRSTTPDTSELVLRQDGLGAVSFGDPVDDVMAVLTGQFGAPTDDELYESPFQVPPGWHGDVRGPDACHVATHGNICFDYIRFVGWENLGLWALFSDIETNPEAAPDDDGYWVQVPPSFQGYGYRGNESVPMYTAHGITVGSTAEDLLALGPIVNFNWTPCGDLVEFTISDQSGSDGGFIYGFLDDQDFEAFQESSIPNKSAQIMELTAGQRSSC